MGILLLVVIIIVIVGFIILISKSLLRGELPQRYGGQTIKKSEKPIQFFLSIIFSYLISIFILIYLGIILLDLITKKL